MVRVQSKTIELHHPVHVSVRVRVLARARVCVSVCVSVNVDVRVFHAHQPGHFEVSRCVLFYLSLLFTSLNQPSLYLSLALLELHPPRAELILFR